MLLSLSLHNFVLIEDAEVQFARGLTVLTGETGAGKTLLTRALGLLAGERAEGGLVGQAGSDAKVQAVFEVDEAALKGFSQELCELCSLEPGELIVTRRLNKQGRNRCYINDTSVTLASLEEVAGQLLSFSGQHEYRNLLDSSYQLAVLDEWSGVETVLLAQQVAKAYKQAKKTERSLEETLRSREARLREIDFLRFQVNELSEAALSQEEERELIIEQRKLSRAEDILRQTGLAADLLSSEGEEADVLTLITQINSLLATVSGVDESLDKMLDDTTGLQYQLGDLARGLRSFLDKIAVDPMRLHIVDERLHNYTDLARKYGGNTAAAMSYLEDSKNKLAQLEYIEEDLGVLEVSRNKNIEEALVLAGELSKKREQAAPRLEQAIALQLADLAMSEASLRVALRPRSGWDGLWVSGLESVEFLLAANPGQEPRSLAKTASGGELSRVLLALKYTLAGVGGSETLILDEIDSGIGGRTATAVAHKIRELANSSQVIVVTHLAQVAAFAETNYVVDKGGNADSAGTSASTHLYSVEGEAMVEELCRMMGGSPDDKEAMAHARGLRDRVAGAC